MAFEINEQNLSALEPLFKPWEEPIRHRLPNPKKGAAAIIKPGRRPSKVPLVRSIRGQVDGWRRGGYAGICPTSRYLLNYWFQDEHQIKDDNGGLIPFRYHWAQREAIETIIYLYEMRGIRSVAGLLSEFGDETIADLALGIHPEEDQWGKYCCKVATGGGKTKIMSLLIVWSFYHSLYEANSELARHFVIIAPNLTVYERLKDDFENCNVFFKDPLLPAEWKSDFQMQVVLQDEPGGSSTTGAIYLSNIHRLYESRDNNNKKEKDSSPIWGPPVKKAQALDTSAALRDRITNHPRIIVLNDEAHHLHDPDLAWNRAIDSLHQQSLSKNQKGIVIQVDFTATPKHNNGDLFRHIICDFPLGEAVDAGIVKVPVLGEADELVERGDKNTPAHERFGMHLKLGYQRYEKTYQEYSKVRKPILFVMTEDAAAANEITDYLNSDAFPLLKGRILNIHTRLKGHIKTVKKYGLEVKEFVENETAMKADDLRELREMSRELDKKHSKFRCVVSVMMLREGWDVRNVTTIVPLRPYSAQSGILPEQTLGRGLRRMFPTAEIPEMVTVVHHPAFRKLYEDELAQEGLDIAVLPIRDAFKQTVTIFVDHDHKPVENLEIEIPLISDSVEMIPELQGLAFNDIKTYFEQHFQRLPIGKKKEGPVEYKERHLFTNELVSSMKLDAGLLTNAWSATGYFAQMIGRVCKLSNPHNVLAPLIEEFLAKVLFEHEVDLFSGEVDHRMRDADVMEHIRATFTPLILEKTVQKKQRKRISNGQRLSAWQPFQATSNEKRPAVQGQRTMFNLVPCENEFEQAFADFCDFAEDVVSFAKNAGPQKLMLDYLRPDGHRALYIPDFFVRVKGGDYYLVELKGKVDLLVPTKASAAIEWCKTASKGKETWHYLYLPYHLFQQSAVASMAELARSCEPTLQGLLREAKTRQAELPLFEETARKETEDKYIEILRQVGLEKIAETIEPIVKQSVQLLDHAIKTKMPDFGHAFQPLLRPFDAYAIIILEKRLKPFIPEHQQRRIAYFKPYLDNLASRQKNLLEKNQHYLEQNLIFGRSIQKLGTLLFCLNYANEGGWNAPGVWQDVVQAFSGSEMSELYRDLSEVNTFRNTHVAHVESKIDDPDAAWEAMVVWVRCLDRMITL